MRLVTAITIFLALLSTFVTVRADTTYTYGQLKSASIDYFDVPYDVSGMATNQDNGYFIFTPITGGTSTLPNVLTTGLTFGKFMLYSTTHVIFFRGSGNYAVYTKSSGHTISMLGSETNLGLGCTNFFYFHPDPIVYIQHDEHPQKLYRYTFNPTTGAITPVATNPILDFGIGPLEFIERTEDGYLGAGASNSVNGYYQIVHISATDGRLIKKIPTYFLYAITGLTYSPSLRRFYVTSKTEISVWDIGNFLKPIFTRLETGDIRRASFSRDGQMMGLLISNTFKFSPVEYSKILSSSISLSSPVSPLSIKTYGNNYFYNEYYSSSLSRKDYSLRYITTTLDPTCIPGKIVCLCDPSGGTPYLTVSTGVCSSSCPDKIYKGTCVSSCPSDSTEVGTDCIPNYVCPNRCAYCENNQCVRCESDHYLYSSNEDGLYDTCLHESILTGFFMVDNSTDGTGVVETCPSGCLVCANKRKCLVC